jgi:hypothetical protein
MASAAILSYKHSRISSVDFEMVSVTLAPSPVVPRASSTTIGDQEEQQIQPKKKRGKGENRS